MAVAAWHAVAGMQSRGGTVGSDGRALRDLRKQGGVTGSLPGLEPAKAIAGRLLQFGQLDRRQESLQAGLEPDQSRLRAGLGPDKSQIGAG